MALVSQAPVERVRKAEPPPKTGHKSQYEQSFRILDRQRSEQDGIEQAEDSGISPDTQSKRQNGYGSKGRAADKGP
jgi:hypothetical protein